jgi:hypothetical protein
VKAPVRLIVLGAGGNSLGILDAVQACNALDPERPRYRLVGILDDIPANLGKRMLGQEVLGPIDTARRYGDCQFVNGISSLASFARCPRSWPARGCRQSASRP